MVNERQTDTCADVMYRRERQRGCGEAGLDFAPFIPSQDEVDQQMSALDDKLVSKAQEQYANRESILWTSGISWTGRRLFSAEAFEENSLATSKRIIWLGKTAVLISCPLIIGRCRM